MFFLDCFDAHSCLYQQMRLTKPMAHLASEVFLPQAYMAIFIQEPDPEVVVKVMVMTPYGTS